jgi:hypothetical protein
MARDFRRLFAHFDGDPTWEKAFKPYMDADTPGVSVFIDRQLNFIMTEVFNTKIPPLKGMVFVPRRSTTPPGAKSISYKQYTGSGIAQWITAPGMDLPTSGLWVKEFTHPIYAMGESYCYTVFDLLAAALASVQFGGPAINLDLEQARRAMIAIEKKLDNVARVGSADGLSPDLGLTGILNNPNATIYTVPNGATGSQAWATKTPDEIAQDMHGIAYSQVASTLETESPDMLGLPLLQYGIVSTKRMGDGSDKTIKQFVLETSPYIKRIEGWQYLKNAGGQGVDRMLCYSNDPSKIWQEVPVEFRQEAPQLENLDIKVPCWAKSGGVICPYPLSLSFGDGV